MVKHQGDFQNGETKCRILLITGQMVGGGLEQQICYLLKGMDRKLYRPGLVVWNCNESDTHMHTVRTMGIPIWGYPPSASSYWKLYSLVRLARNLRPEVVHSYCFFTNFAAFCAARAAGAIGIGSVRGENDLGLRKTHPVLGRLSSSFPGEQISNSHAAANKALKSDHWFTPRKMTVVPNSLDLDRFREEPVPVAPPHHILGIGSLIIRKRWDRLLKVGRELKRRGIPFVIEIAGQGPLQHELELMASNFGITDSTHFLGHRNDIPDLIAGARLIVHTAEEEGSPNAVMEAMASGRAVVATDVGDVGKLIENGTTGFVVAREDFDALLSRVIEILTDDQRAAQMGKSAQDYARREFRLPRLAERTIEVYRSAGWKPHR